LIPSRRHESLVFEVTQACNHDCPHCYNVWKNAAPYPAGELDTAATMELYGKVLDESGVMHITLTGGEPLLRKDLHDLVEFLRARHATLNLISNGGLLTEQAIERFLPDKISVFELPLLSVERGIHDRMSGSPGAFDRVTMATALLKAAKQRVVTVFVATRLNLPTLPQTLELALALGADGVMLNRFNPGGRGCQNLEQLQADPRQLREALDAAQLFSEQYDFPISCSIAMPPCLFDTKKYSRLGFGFCAAGTPRAYYTVDPLGHLRACNHSPTILGNLRTQGFWELVDGQRLKTFVAARPEFCRGCRMENECLGGCKAAAEACCGSVCEMDPFLKAFQHEAVRIP
jgi:radical SAM protein with 4Fe4S-binding SPASM domain